MTQKINFPRFNKVEKYLVTERNKVPLLVGSVVYIKDKPAYISEVSERTGFVYITTMDERKEHLRVFPQDIGAIWLQS